MALAFTLLWLCPGSGLAQPPANAPPAAQDEAADKRKAIAIGSLLLGLVVVSGLALVAMVLILGRRTRLLARKSLPGVRPLAPLWFLRGSPPRSPESSQPADEE